MSWNKLPDDIINLIFSTRREMLRIDACEIVLDRAYHITEGLKEAYKRAQQVVPCPTLTPELATTMEWAVEVVSGKESSKLWLCSLMALEYLLWQNAVAHGENRLADGSAEYDSCPGEYYNRIHAAYLTLIERFFGAPLAWQLEQHVEF